MRAISTGTLYLRSLAPLAESCYALDLREAADGSLYATLTEPHTGDPAVWTDEAGDAWRVRLTVERVAIVALADRLAS